jgi:hypothetical protein
MSQVWKRPDQRKYGRTNSRQTSNGKLLEGRHQMGIAKRWNNRKRLIAQSRHRANRFVGEDLSPSVFATGRVLAISDPIRIDGLSDKVSWKMVYHYMNKSSMGRCVVMEGKVPPFGTWSWGIPILIWTSRLQKTKKAGRLCPAWKSRIGCGGQICLP